MAITNFLPFNTKVGGKVYAPDELYAGYPFESIKAVMENKNNGVDNVIVPSFMHEKFINWLDVHKLRCYVWVVHPLRWNAKERYMECGILSYLTAHCRDQPEYDWSQWLDLDIDKEIKKVVGDRISHRCTEMAPQKFVNLRNSEKLKINPERDILAKLEPKKLKAKIFYRWHLPTASELLEVKQSEFYKRNTANINQPGVSNVNRLNNIPSK